MRCGDVIPWLSRLERGKILQKRTLKGRRKLSLRPRDRVRRRLRQFPGGEVNSASAARVLRSAQGKCEPRPKK